MRRVWMTIAQIHCPAIQFSVTEVLLIYYSHSRLARVCTLTNVAR